MKTIKAIELEDSDFTSTESRLNFVDRLKPRVRRKVKEADIVVYGGMTLKNKWTLPRY